MSYGTKTNIKACYIANLQATYPFYTEGSRPLEMARLAADTALSGVGKLDGECWYKALAANGVQKAASRKMLAELPA